MKNSGIQFKMLFRIKTRVLKQCTLSVLSRFSTSLETTLSNCDEDEQLLQKSVSFMKSLRIAIIGLPNAGKSTLINQLVNRDVCPTSCKVHTTRTKSEAIFVENNTQLVFIDTPGLVSERDYKRYNFEASFKKDVDKSLQKADIVGVVQDMENPRAKERISKRILPLLEAYGKDRSSILIINKIDRVKKKSLLEVVKNLTDERNWPHFCDIFMISALNNDGVDDLRNYLIDCAQWRKWEYDSSIYIDQTPESLIQNTVKARLLDELPQEVPYSLSVRLEHLDVHEEGTINTLVKIVCPAQRLCKVVLGPGGQTVKEISQLCERALSNAFRTPVRLKLAIESKLKTNNKHKHH